MFEPDIGDPTSQAAWLELWQSHFGTPKDVCVAVGHGALRLTPERRKGARLLRSYTNGHAQRSLVEPPASQADVAAVLGMLKQMSGWDGAHLQGLHPAWARSLCDQARGMGMVSQGEHSFHHYFADIADDPDAYLAARSKSTFKRKASSERALERLVPLEFRQDDPAHAIAAYMDAERKSWKAGAGELLSDTPLLRSFYEGVAALEQTHLYGLWANGEMIAGYIGLESRTHVVCLKTFFSADYAKYSIGFVLMRRVIDDLIARGFRGRIDLYTDKVGFKPFATGADTYEDIMIWNTTARSGLLRRARQLMQRRHGKINAP